MGVCLFPVGEDLSNLGFDLLVASRFGPEGVAVQNQQDHEAKCGKGPNGYKLPSVEGAIVGRCAMFW